MSKLAFLIQQLGGDNSDERRLADRKRNEIIAPVCEKEGFELVRADEFSSASIVEPITSKLSTSALVIADLGTPPWNQNVLLEIGFRLATGLPIVVVADVDASPEQLPVHLQNRRIIHLELEEPERSIERLHAVLGNQQDRSGTWQSDYPLIEFFLPLEEGGSSPHFINVNNAAAELYGYESAEELLNTTLEEADKKLQEYMPPKHRSAFEDDQLRLFPIARKPGKRDPVTAKIPAWIYRKHPVKDRLNHLYWPVLLQHKFAKDKEGIVMNVAFLDVTNWENDAHHLEPDSVVEMPWIFRFPPIDYHVFLSYNSKDVEYARALQKILHRMGLRVWIDEEDLVRTRGLSREILRSMSNSRAIFAMFGTNGLGPWQEKTELMTKMQDILQQKQPFAVLLLDELRDEENSERWTEYVPTEFQTAFKEQSRFFLPELDELQRLASEEPSFSDEILKLLVEAIDKPHLNRR